MDFRDFNKSLNVLEEWAKVCIVEMQQMLAHTDNLKNSISYVIEEGNNGWVVSFEMPEYAVFVNDGRRAGAKPPPIEPIKKWAIQKNLPTFTTSGGKPISEDSRAFLIARAIGRRGIKPIPFMDVPNEKRNELANKLGVSFAIDLASEYQIRFNKAGIGE